MFMHGQEFANPFTLGISDGLGTTPTGENNVDMFSFIERWKSYIEEYKYNLNLATSKFKIINAKENGVNSSFLLNVLIEAGSVAAFDGSKINKPVIFQPYTTKAWNYQIEPTQITIVPYYDNSLTLDKLGVFSKDLSNEGDKKQFEIIYLNETRTGFNASLAYEARIISMLNQCLLNNILAKSLNIALQGKSADQIDAKAIVNKIFNQSGIVAIDTDSKPDINELVKSIDIAPEWLADKIFEAKKNARHELHERLGITHAPYEKKERLTNVEIETQNEAADLLSQSTLDTINKGLSKVNDAFKLEYPLSVEFTEIGINTEDKTENIDVNKTENIDENGGGENE